MNNETYQIIQTLAKGARVTVEATVTNLSWTKGAREDLTFLGWFGPQPLFTRVSDGTTIPFVAFQMGHIVLV